MAMANVALRRAQPTSFALCLRYLFLFTAAAAAYYARGAAVRCSRQSFGAVWNLRCRR
jgi:hypothetical protein